MVRAILTLHFYQETNFLGQKLQWIEVTSTGALGTLIDLLAFGRRHHEFHGTEQYPTQSDAFKCIKHELELVYTNPYRPADELMKRATSVRVMQVQEGWPFEVPHALVY